MKSPSFKKHESVSGYQMFDIGRVTLFIQQLPCPAHQHQHHEVTELRTGLANSLKFTYK